MELDFLTSVMNLVAAALALGVGAIGLFKKVFRVHKLCTRIWIGAGNG